MLNKINVTKASRGLALAAFLSGGVVFSVNSISAVSAQTETKYIETIVFDRTLPASVEEIEVRSAVETFIRGMSRADAQTVWMFASEEDQAAFGTEEAVYEAFAEVFPALTQAQEVRFDSFSQEGDTPFVQLSLTDKQGVSHQATMGLWLDDAGDWKLVSCEVNALSDRIASL